MQNLWKNNIAQLIADKCLRVLHLIVHFITVVLWRRKGDYPQINVLAFSPDKLCSFAPFMRLNLVLER